MAITTKTKSEEMAKHSKHEKNETRFERRTSRQHRIRRFDCARAKSKQTRLDLQ